MEENNPDNKQEEQSPEVPSTTSAPQNISLSDAIAGVFSEPGNTFTEVKASSKSNYWVWPLIILALITALASYIVLRDEDLSSEIKKMQTDVVKEKLDKEVKSGSMTREQADEQLEKTNKMFGGGMFVVFGILGGFFTVIIFFFLRSLVYWGAFKIFKGNGTFVNIMNVLGLASIITSVQAILNTVLAIFTGKLFINIGPVLLFTQEQLGKDMFKFVASFDLISLWCLAVIAIGCAKVSNLKSSVTFPVVYGLWLLWTVLTSFVTTSFIGM